ncbi:MAG: hypothetical protein Q8P34_21375 [Bacteroidota bacterium]|nr:hypothetical protein [Bacteroidota bacterium]
MPQRDYLMQQLEEMGYFLSGILRRFLKLKEENREEEITSVLHDAIQEKLSFSIDEAIELKDDDFLKLIKEQIKPENHLETMAELLLVTGKSIHSFVSPVRLSYLQKSLLLYTHLQETSTNFSFERKDKILEIQQIIRG